MDSDDVYSTFINLVRANGLNDSAIDCMIRAVLMHDMEMVDDPDVLAAYDELIDYYSIPVEGE